MVDALNELKKALDADIERYGRAVHAMDLVAYEGMGLVLSLIETGQMPITYLATANDLADRFAKAKAGVTLADAARRIPTPRVPHV